MTQPSLNATFDTSLIDVQPGLDYTATSTTTTFSSTASDTDTSCTMENQMAEVNASSTRPYKDLPTTDAYNAWATTYDTDRNILQAIDDIYMPSLLDRLLSPLLPQSQRASLSITDLGCGTGRNTLKLLSYPWPAHASVRVTGIDASEGMLALAKEKCTQHSKAQAADAASTVAADVQVIFQHHDILTPISSPLTSPSSSKDIPPTTTPADALLCTLVLEHMPLAPFFNTLSRKVRPGGRVLLTNMHPEMGERTQAGIVNSAGERVRGVGFAHGVSETVRAAEEAGFVMLGEVEERAVAESDVAVGGTVRGRGKKWVGVRVWYGMVLERRFDACV